MDEIYLLGFKQDSKIFLPTVSVITIFIKEYCKTKLFNLRLVSKTNNPAMYPVVFQLSSFSNAPPLTVKDTSAKVQSCRVTDMKCCLVNKVLSGFCTVLKHIFPPSSFSDIDIIDIEECPDGIRNCVFPAIKCYHSNTILSGLCSVLRHVLKISAKQENVSELLSLLVSSIIFVSTAIINVFPKSMVSLNILN